MAANSKGLKKNIHLNENLNTPEYCQRIVVFFMVLRLSEELCSHLSNQVNRGMVALL